MYKIAMIGAGNVAWHLAPALEVAGHRITEVYSRHLSNARDLAERLYSATACDQTDFSQSKASLFLLCVPDKVILQLLPQLRLPAGAILAHTSGTQPMQVLEKRSLPGPTGVFYPLQTFSKSKEVNFEEIPFCLEASAEATLDVLAEIAEGLTEKIYHLSSQQRQTLHLAAVFASNFSNHVLSIARDILEREQIDFDMLQPLIEETMTKAFLIGPEQAQTGPARRGDQPTIDRHLNYLNAYPMYKKVYQTMSESIAAFYTKKEKK